MHGACHPRLLVLFLIPLAALHPALARGELASLGVLCFGVVMSELSLLLLHSDVVLLNCFLNEYLLLQIVLVVAGSGSCRGLVVRRGPATVLVKHLRLGLEYRGRAASAYVRLEKPDSVITQ